MNEVLNCLETRRSVRKYLPKQIADAELNAILNAGGRVLRGARLYVALFPCNECAKAIIQAGIKRLVYDSDKYNGTPSTIASRKMLSAAGVDIQKYEHTGRIVTIQL